MFEHTSEIEWFSPLHLYHPEATGIKFAQTGIVREFKQGWCAGNRTGSLDADHVDPLKADFLLAAVRITRQVVGIPGQCEGSGGVRGMTVQRSVLAQQVAVKRIGESGGIARTQIPL